MQQQQLLLCTTITDLLAGQLELGVELQKTNTPKVVTSPVMYWETR